MFNELEKQAYNSALEIIASAKLKPDDILVVGCSTSEILGERIGTNSSPEAAKAVFDGIYTAANERGVYIAAQCCEHLNRAIIVESKAVPFATAAYHAFKQPVAVEEIKADAGLDIGFTMIGMHIKRVAVPVRLENNKIGNATVLAARRRAKFIGGERACYDQTLT